MSDFLPDKVRRGRVSKWRFTQTPQWALLMSELSDPGYRIYSLLLAHVNHDDDDGEVWPQQQTMAEMLDKHRNSISRVITKELEPLGLVDVEVERYGTNSTRRRNIYTVHELPPDNFTGWASLAEWYAAHARPEPAPTNRRDRKDAGQPGRTKNGASGRTTDGASGRTKTSAVTRRRKNKTKGEASSPPTPSERGSRDPGSGREDEISPENTERRRRGDFKTPRAQTGGTCSPAGPGTNDETLSRAQTLVDDAVRLWPRNHKAPGVRDRQRLSERVAAELAAGGDPEVIVHELSRDMQDAGNAVRVIMGDRTKVPGWGQAADPRPDHSRHEVRTKTPWCGQCDERTRMVRVYDPATGRTSPARCRQPVPGTDGSAVACHPQETVTPVVFDEDQGEDLVEADGETVAAAMRASLEQARERPEQPQPRQSPGAAAEARRIAREAQQKRQATEATQAAVAQIRDAALREEAARLARQR